jgi:dihydrofolate reductase
MGRIVISENVSLDGVIQDPTGDEGFRHGGWSVQIPDKDRDEWAKVLLDEALGAEAQLLGRRTYEFFAARFPSRSGAWADRLNSMPKYVVSSTLVDPDWNNTTVLNGEVVNEVSKLKQELDGEIVVYASSQLVPTLIEHDLVDELRLIVYPVVLGAGERLSARPATRRRCACSTPRPSVTASPTSPTSSSGRRSGVGLRRRSETPGCPPSGGHPWRAALWPAAGARRSTRLALAPSSSHASLASKGGALPPRTRCERAGPPHR